MDNRKLAVLIDSDNTQYSKLHLIIEELSGYGQIIVKRAYGDFSSEHLKISIGNPSFFTENLRFSLENLGDLVKLLGSSLGHPRSSAENLRFM